MTSPGLESLVTRPLEAISSLSVADYDAFVSRVSTHFRDALDSQLDAVPSLVDIDPSQHVGKLVRFEAMVQDSTLGTEVFAPFDGETVLAFTEAAPQQATLDGIEAGNVALHDRALAYVVEVPGRSAWAKQARRGKQDLSAQVEGLSVADKSSSAHAAKFPIPGQPHVAALVKLYGNDDVLKSTTVLEFVGVLQQAHFTPTASFDPQDQTESSAPTMPCIHVLFHSAPRPLPIEPSHEPSVRSSLIEHLSEHLSGDLDAAEWLLLHLVSRIHNRRAGLRLGALPLNLITSSSSSDPADLKSVLEALLPALVASPLTIDSLNKTRLQPRSADEGLEAGLLQLPAGTQLLFDERGMREGQLNDQGVRNVQALTNLLNDGKLGYVFPFSEFSFDADLNLLVLSHGRSLLPLPCAVAVQSSEKAEATKPDAASLQSWRSLLLSAKAMNCEVSEAIAKHIETEFVGMRQKASAEQAAAITQEMLLMRMTVARLVAISSGKTSLDEESWRHAVQLDDRRLARLAAVSKK